MALNNDQLLARAITGDRDSLAQLLKAMTPTLRPRILPQIGRAWRSMIDTDDVLQVTFLEVFLDVGRCRPSSFAEFEGWVERIAVNNLKDAIRGLTRKKRPDPRQRVSREAGPDSYSALLELAGGDSTTPSRAVRSDELQSIVRSALARLPSDYRAVLELYDVQGKTAQDVGRIMGRSAAAIFMIRGRALKRLHSLLSTSSAFFSSGA